MRGAGIVPRPAESSPRGGPSDMLLTLTRTTNMAETTNNIRAAYEAHHAASAHHANAERACKEAQDMLTRMGAEKLVTRERLGGLAFAQAGGADDERFILIDMPHAPLVVRVEKIGDNYRITRHEFAATVTQPLPS